MSEQPSLPDLPTPPATGSPKRSRRRSGSRGGVQKGRLKVHDPFELVRWLALSQPDPRKALAELVQNSLDAGASTIEIVRFRKKGVACLEVRDDGEGVIPELPRDEALEYLATHVGHSRKRSLSPRERLELMTQGQYGIGLLGFWSLGERLEIETLRTSAGEDVRPHRLTLHRDRRNYLIEPMRTRRSDDTPSTVVRIQGVHEDALPVLTARRASVFLGNELRGQLLARRTEITVQDRMARGRAPRRLSVEATRYSGTSIEVTSVPVEGYPDVHLDLYLVERARNPTPLALYSAGTLVAESFSELGGLGLDHPPWTDVRLTGAVEFPALTVAPGSRRGVVPDQASAALQRALEQVAPRVEFALQQEEERREEELDRTLVKNLQKAFRGIGRSLTRLALLPVHRGDAGPSGGNDDGGGEGHGDGLAAAPGAVETPEVVEPPPGFTSSAAPEIEVAPSGPLVSVELHPPPLHLTPGNPRIVRARALDAEGRVVGGRVDYLWRLIGLSGTLEELPSLGSKVRLFADEAPAQGRLRVTACQGDRRASTEIEIEVHEPRDGGDGSEGVPEPELVSDPGGRWRSRLEGERWQVNSAHDSYLAVSDRPALKLRYLALLFAKEVVVMNHRDPKLVEPLEEMIDVFAYADRNLTR